MNAISKIPRGLRAESGQPARGRRCRGSGRGRRRRAGAEPRRGRNEFTRPAGRGDGRLGALLLLRHRVGGGPDAGQAPARAARRARRAAARPTSARSRLRTLLRLVDGVGFYLVGLVVMLAHRRAPPAPRRHRGRGHRRRRRQRAAAPKAVSKVRTIAAPAASSASAAPDQLHSGHGAHARGRAHRAGARVPPGASGPGLPRRGRARRRRLLRAGRPGGHLRVRGRPEPEPETVAEPEEDLGAELAEDESPRIEIISEAEAEDASAPSGGRGPRATARALGADWSSAARRRPRSSPWPTRSRPRRLRPTSDEDSDDSTFDSLPRVVTRALAELADDVAATTKDRDPGASAPRPSRWPRPPRPDARPTRRSR